MLGFGDVLRVARDVLRDHREVACEVGRSLDVLLVDEFQDTSRLQRDLVQLLWAEDERRVSGAIPHIGDARRHGLFVVGDRKQSIYGFRGADVSVFAELCVGLAGAPAREALGIVAGAAWEPDPPLADFVSLRHNRRGNGALLAFANAFSRERFKVREPPAELFEIEYRGETEDLRVPSGESVEPQAPRTTWLRFADEAAPSRLDEATVIASRIVTIIASGEPRVLGRSPMFRDIAVLTQTNEMLDAAAFALAQRAVPHVASGRGFYSATEVGDLASMLSLILDPSDKLALAEVLRGPWAGVHDLTLLGLTDQHRGLVELGPAWESGERRNLVHSEDFGSVKRLRRTVEALARNVDHLGPAGVLRQAVRELRLEEVLALLPRGEQRVANVRKLLLMAEREPHPARFLERLRDLMAREAAETEAATFSDEDDAVRLLTVHASKGLAFPIVFIPQAGALPRPRERGFLALDLGTATRDPTIAVKIADPEMGALEAPSFARSVETADRRERAERQRLAYVAVTRASEAMFFVGDRRPPKSGDGLSYSSTDAASLREIVSTEMSREAASLAVEMVSETSANRASVALAPDRVCRPDPPPAFRPLPPSPPWRVLAVAPTSLQDFAHCRRRFQLAHVLGLPERAPQKLASPLSDNDGDAGQLQGNRLDPRAEGTLVHRVLERLPRETWGTSAVKDAASDLLVHEGLPKDHPVHSEVVTRVTRFAAGKYAVQIARAGAQIAREVPFVLRVPDAEGRTLVLRGSMDLLVRWPDGSVEVVDYKRARGPSPEPYAFQLDVYLLAAKQASPEGSKMRAGIVFLGGDAAQPIWRPAPDLKGVEERLCRLGLDLMVARWTETFPRASQETCRAIRCGYFHSCYPDTKSGERQLSLPLNQGQEP
jgi:ATP-dependent helicase/nuclease subunit A